MRKWTTNARAKRDTRPWALERVAVEKGLLELANRLAALRKRFGH